MVATSRKKPTKEKLAVYAEAIRKELDEFRHQDDLYRTAVEIGFLAARADGEVADEERQAIVDAIDILSQGVVIELEVDSIFEEVEAMAGDDSAKAQALGKKLKELGQADAGLLFGAFVAVASAGIDKSERAVLREVGKAAGIANRRVGTILKVVGDDAGD